MPKLLKSATIRTRVNSGHHCSIVYTQRTHCLVHALPLYLISIGWSLSFSARLPPDLPLTLGEKSYYFWHVPSDLENEPKFSKFGA
jgi:hypothetical protein